MSQKKIDLRTLFRVTLLCAISLFAAALQGCVPKTTAPTEVGVTVLKWNPFGKQGVLDRVYSESGTYFLIPYLMEWHTFSSNLQNIEMTIKKNRGDKRGRDDLVFKTIDGNDISLDVIISYRIIKNKAPYILEHVAANDQQLREKIVRIISRSKPRDIFGELTTEEFAVPENREAKAEKAKTIMNQILEPLGVKVETVWTKDYRFNPQYQKAIEERKIADQQTQKNKAAINASIQEYKRKLEQAAGEVNKMRAEADGEYLSGKLAADAYFEQQKLLADAIETEGDNIAKALEQRVKALHGRGGDLIVKMRMAEALKGKKIILLPLSGGGMDIKTTDINKLLELYGVKSISPKNNRSKNNVTILPLEPNEATHAVKPAQPTPSAVITKSSEHN